jgi:hypothetical protein
MPSHDKNKSKKPTTSKSKNASEGKTSFASKPKDARFNSLVNDPRFKRPKKKDVKVKIDQRFKSMFDESFDDGGRRKT